MLPISPKILVIKSDKIELLKVEKFLSDIFKEFNLTSEYFNKTVLCVSEAVINSIEHGNQFDNKKNITLEVKCFGGEIDILIKDEGDGFDFNTIEDPTTSDNIMKESGRGLHIIRSLSTSISYNEKGNCVQLKIECK